MLAVTGRHGAGKTRLRRRFCGRILLWSAAWRKCCVLPPTAPHEKPCVLIIDECEKLDGLVVNLWGRLQAFWDLNKDGTRMLLVFSARISPWGFLQQKVMFAGVSLDPRPCDTAKLTRAAAAFCRKYPETAGWEKRFGSLSRADA